MTSRAETVLSGPRGRRLCLAVLFASFTTDWPKDALRGDRSDPARARRFLDDVVARADLDAVAAGTEPAEFRAALLAAVDTALYWQEPYEADRVLADDDVSAGLRPVAEAVAAAPGTQWWAEPMAPADQHTLVWEPADAQPRWSGARSALDHWRDETLRADRRAARERPTDPRANWSGEWWSTPVEAELVATTRAVPGLGAESTAPAGLILVEDELGWSDARSWPVPAPASTTRLLEITGAGDWVDLVQRHPLEVTASRRHDWWRVTGIDRRWVIPDWTVVAEAFDAVHLTVDGYLSTAGRALSVDLPGGSGHSVLSGWNPDATWWLTDLVPGGEPTDWRREDDEPPRWRPATTG